MNAIFDKCYDDWGNLKDNALNIAFNLGKKKGYRKGIKQGIKQGKLDGAREFAEWLANGCTFMRRLGEDDMHTVDELISKWQEGAKDDNFKLE